MFKMTIETETGEWTKAETTVCYSEDQVAADREHYRSLAPRGATQTIKVEPLKV